MKEMLLITGVFDRLSGGSSSEESSETEYSIEDYQELLNEYRDAEAEILINMATIYFEEENIRESLKNLENALEIYDELEDAGKQALVLDLMGDVNQYNEQIAKALDNYRESYQLYSAIDSDNKEVLHEKIEELEIQQNAGEAQQKYNVVKVPDEIKKTSDYSKISQNVEMTIGLLEGADTYRSYTKSENPMKELQNAFEMSNGIGDNAGKAAILLIMGDVSLRESKINDALKYFNNALDSFKEIDDKIGEAVSRLLIGTAYYLTGDMEKVPANFRKSIEIFRSLNDINGENIAIHLMNAIYTEE